MTETFCAILTLVISTIVSILVTKLTIKSEGRKALHDHLDNILNIAIEYPYLEDKKFTDNWSENNLTSDNEEVRLKNIRYEYYAIKVFNYLERFGKHYNWLVTDMEKEMNIKEWFEVHENYWDYTSKSNGYCIELHNLMNRYKK